jgi:hypothetical protein
VELENMTKDELNYSISRFLCEVKKQNGDHYPGKTLHELVICIQLYFELKGVSNKFLQDSAFLELRNTLDRKMQERAQSGVGIHKKQAEVITIEEEEALWNNNIRICNSSTASEHFGLSYTGLELCATRRTIT